MSATVGRELSRVYTDLHEGRGPSRILNQKVPAYPRTLTPLGRLAEIQYRKLTPDGEHSYWHPFAKHARPLMARDERGRLWIYAGPYTVTERGIEDLPRWQVKRDALPPRPDGFVDLGRLEWVKYVRQGDDGTETGVYEFPAADAPTLAHHAGNLWVLGGRYELSAEGEKEVMAKSIVKRANPTPAKGQKEGTLMEKGQAVLLSSLVVGGVAYGTHELMNMVLPKISATKFTLPSYTRGAVKIVAGVLLGTGAYMAPLPGRKAVAAGLGIGGTISGLSDIVAVTRAARMRSTAPGGIAYLPVGGMPSGYAPTVGQRVAR